jgi:Na+(H+)/acetate symporter ActP
MGFLHDDALGAAAGTLARLAHVHLALWCAGAKRAGAGGVRGHLLVVAADLADEVVEGVLDVDAGFGGGFDELAAELAGERFTLCFC